MFKIKNNFKRFFLNERVCIIKKISKSKKKTTQKRDWNKIKLTTSSLRPCISI